MYDVELEVVKDNIIKAPIHCPYKYKFSKGEGEFYEEIFVVNSSICTLCRLCNFKSKLSIDIKEKEFVKYLTYQNEEVYDSILRQSSYLRKNNRIPLIILISPVVFDCMINFVYRDYSQEDRNAIKSYFFTKEKPICYILGCPVYLSPKLTKSSIMVVGEIEWK
jgi:hypothetical protein